MNPRTKLMLFSLVEAFIIAFIISVPAIWWFWDMTP